MARESERYEQNLRKLEAAQGASDSSGGDAARTPSRIRKNMGKLRAGDEGTADRIEKRCAARGDLPLSSPRIGWLAAHGVADASLLHVAVRLRHGDPPPVEGHCFSVVGFLVPPIHPHLARAGFQLDGGDEVATADPAEHIQTPQGP